MVNPMECCVLLESVISPVGSFLNIGFVKERLEAIEGEI